MNLSERLQRQIDEINAQTLKTGAKIAKTVGKKLVNVGKSAIKRNAGTAEAAIVAGVTAPLGQKLYDRIEKSRKMKKKSREQVEKTVKNQIATRDQ